MLLKTVLIAFCILIATSAEDKLVPPEPPGTLGPTTPNSTTTSVKPTPFPNTTTSTTTTPKSTTTTPSTTPTPTPNTTTTSSTTPAPPTPNTTTTSTTTAAPITTPKPTPDDKLSVNDYVGNYTGRAKICLMARMAVQVEVLGKNSTMINIPKSVKYSVDCGTKDTEFLNISWAGVANNGSNNSISFEFFRNDSKYEIRSINTSVFMKDGNITVKHTNAAFVTSQKLSYYCAKDQALNLTDSTNKTMAKVHLSSLHYQAFMNTTNPEFASVWDCDGTNTSDVVPVVVGCVLAILVVLVLAVYLIGRRRCQSRGYLSMFAQEKNESDYIPMKTLSCFN